MNKACVVTGVSTGIGEAVARKLAAEGFRVFGSVRRAADADALKQALGDAFTPLIFDVTDAPAVRAAADEVGRALGSARLAGLVNNAGIANAAPLLHVPLEELRQHFEINVIGQVAAIQAFAPLLGSDRARTGAPGRIVNISSTAGRLGTPFLGAYCGSKFAMEGISDSLRRELLIYGIDVVVIEPGAVVTPIWDKAENASYAAYDKTDYRQTLKALASLMISEGRKGVAPAKIAEAVYRALNDAKPPARVAVVPQRFKNWTVPRLLPDRALDQFVARLIGLKRV